MIRRLWRGGERRRRQALGRWSRFVDLMRFLLPATAVLLAALIVAWPYVMGEQSGFIMPDRQLRDVAVDPMRMQSPRYVGRGRDERPYEVTASSAVLDPEAPDRIYLDELEADLADPGRDLAFQARTGIYDREARRLDLSGGIDVRWSDGYELQTESARVDLDSGGVVGSLPVEGRGPAGRLSAARFSFEDGGRVLHFEGQVKATFLAPAAREARP